MPRHPSLSVLCQDQIQLGVVPQHLHEVDCSPRYHNNNNNSLLWSLLWSSLHIAATFKGELIDTEQRYRSREMDGCNHSAFPFCSFIQLTESGVAKLLAHYWGIDLSPAVVTNGAPSIIFAYFHSPTPNWCTALQSHQASNTNWEKKLLIPTGLPCNWYKIDFLTRKWYASHASIFKMQAVMIWFMTAVYETWFTSTAFNIVHMDRSTPRSESEKSAQCQSS